MRKFLRALTRSTYVQAWDPSRGGYGYYVKETNEYFKDKKPLILGGESWDPLYIPDWSRYKVCACARVCVYVCVHWLPLPLSLLLSLLPHNRSIVLM